MGPSEDEDGEFAKELAKMVIDTSTESRKVDKKTALALWDSAVLPPSARRRKVEEVDETESAVKDTNVMTFTVVTKRGNKQQVWLGVLYVCCFELMCSSSDTSIGCTFDRRAGCSHTICSSGG